jgi:hypothetical protein
MQSSHSLAWGDRWNSTAIKLLHDAAEFVSGEKPLAVPLAMSL